MARGITETDVWQAADALLLEGARPTIERVRQKLGRGSPNTVSPFLETWFRHLGARIKDPGAFVAPPAAPDPVLQAARHFWEAARAETRRDFDERLQEGLAAAVANVEAEKERAAISDAAAFEAASKLARVQAELAQTEASLAHEKGARGKVETLLGDTRKQVDQLRERLDQALAQTAQVREASQHAISEALERFAAAERRAALEIDAERTARAKAEKRALAEEEQERQARAKADKQADTLRALLAQAQQRERDAALEHADALARLQTQLGASLDAQRALSQSKDDLSRELSSLREQTAASQQEVTQYRTEAQTVRALLERFRPVSEKARAVGRGRAKA
jgi:chromosome segregation ATPase